VKKTVLAFLLVIVGVVTWVAHVYPSSSPQASVQVALDIQKLMDAVITELTKSHPAAKIASIYFNGANDPQQKWNYESGVNRFAYYVCALSDVSALDNLDDVTRYHGGYHPRFSRDLPYRECGARFIFIISEGVLRDKRFVAALRALDFARWNCELAPLIVIADDYLKPIVEEDIVDLLSCRYLRGDYSVAQYALKDSKPLLIRDRVSLLAEHERKTFSLDSADNSSSEQLFAQAYFDNKYPNLLGFFGSRKHFALKLAVACNMIVAWGEFPVNNYVNRQGVCVQLQIEADFPQDEIICFLDPYANIEFLLNKNLISTSSLFMKKTFDELVVHCKKTADDIRWKYNLVS